jgi:hypothetical protein
MTDVPENCVAGKTVFLEEEENHTKPLLSTPREIIDRIIWIVIRRNLKNPHQEVRRLKNCGGSVEWLGTTGRIST